MPHKPFGFGLAGIISGCLCLATLYLIEMYGPSSYSSSGSGSVSVAGVTHVVSSTSSLLPVIAQSVFLLLFVSLALGMIALFRKEGRAAVLGSLGFGVAPICIYLLGSWFTFMIYFGITLPVAGIVLLKRCTA